MVNLYSQNTDVKKGDRIYYQGNEYSVVSSDKWHTFLEDKNGNIVRVNLKNSAFDECKEYCQKMINEYSEKYEQRSELAKYNLTEYYKQKKQAEIYKFEADKLLKNGPFNTLSNSQKNEYNTAMKNYKVQKNLASDSEFAWSLNNGVASDCNYSRHKWCLQLHLAKAIENSIFGG